AVLPDDGIASFQLHPSQSRSLNAFMNMNRLQAALEMRDRVNALFFAARSRRVALDPEAIAQLDEMIEPRLADYGIRIEKVQQTYREQDEERTAFEYLHLINDRLVWSDSARDAAREALPPAVTQELLTYLANSIAVGELSDGDSDRVIPYSTIVAVDSNDQLGPLVDEAGQAVRLEDGEIALNRWAVDDFSAKIGDSISLRYFAPETTHGVAQERTEKLKLAAVAELTTPATPPRRRRAAVFDRRPTLATDIHLTPTVKGVTDQETIADWDPPFPFDQRRIRDQDDDYWESFRTTPKAFVSLATGKRLWGSRFGEATAFRVPVDTGSAEQLASTLERSLFKRKQDLGFGVLPIKSNALRASQGTTSFAGLFFGFSLFLIVAALALLSILFRLGIELRGRELGLLAALGWTLPRSRRLLMLEGTVVGLCGALLGIAGGAAFASLMLSGLRTWWVDAIVTPFVHFYANPASILGGGLASIFTCLLVMGLGLREMLHREPRQLLAGNPAMPGRARRSPGAWWPIVLFVVLAAISAGWATGLTAEAQAGAFFAGGFCLLMAGLLGLRRLLRATAEVSGSQTLTLTQLAWKGLARNPGRTMLTAGLISAATFLIMAIAAFRLTPGEQGTGGFDLVAETDRPLFVDFEDPQVKRRVWGDQASRLDDVRVVGMRAEPGSDASCRNLYQATRPRMFGVSRRDAEGVLADAAFTWAGAIDPYQENPW
ncbi:MAG: FtsX-like permease family protein, partial [Planctomycetota bacterium]